MIQVSVMSSFAAESVTVSYRLLRHDGELVYGSFTVPVTFAYTTVTYSEGLAEGFLLSVSCRAVQANTRGITFARVSIVNQSQTAAFASYVLMSDYVTFVGSGAHPNGRVLSSLEGPGNIRLIPVPSPAPSADWLTFQPNHTRWRLQGMTGTFTTSAAVGNRSIAILTASDATLNGSGYANKTVPANSPVNVIGSCAFLPTPLTSSIVSVALPSDRAFLQNGFVQSSTSSMQAGDQWTGISISVEEWLDNV
jgi:hypothetical protein